MANKVTIDVETKLIDHSSGPAKQATNALIKLGKSAELTQKKLDRLGKKRKKAPLDFNDSKINKKIRFLEKRVNKFLERDTILVLQAADYATGVISKVSYAAKSLNRDVVTSLSVKDNAYGAMQKVLAASQRVAGTVFTVTMRMADQVTDPLRMVQDAVSSIRAAMSNIKGNTSSKDSEKFSLFSDLPFLSNPVVDKVLVQPVKLSDQQENTKMEMETWLGSPEKAEAFMSQIQDKIEFDPTQIIGLSQKMMELGWESRNVLPDLWKLSDWAASMGKGEGDIEQVAGLLSQMRQSGSISADGMQQLTEAGVSGWEYLSNYLGKTVPEVMKMAEMGQIGVNDGINGILKGMEEFRGSAEDNADRTVSGILGQMDRLMQNELVLPWGEGLASGLKKGLLYIKQLLGDNKETLMTWGQNLKIIAEGASQFLADTMISAIKRLNDVMETSEFKNADLGNKIHILWSEIIEKPFSAWWSSSGAALAEGAASIGVSIGKGIIKGLVEILKDHPIIATLLGGLGVTKLLGSSSLRAGIGVIKKAPGAMKKFVGSAEEEKGLLGFGRKTAKFLGAKNGPRGVPLSAGAMSAVGLGAIAGGAVGLATTGKGISDIYQASKIEDKVDQKAKAMNGTLKLSGGAAGAAIGGALGSTFFGIGAVPGALIGYGLGSLAGWLGGNAAEKAIQKNGKSAAYLAEQEEKAAQEAAELKAKTDQLAKTSLDEHFGDITLSAREMSSTIQNMIGKDVLERVESTSNALDTMHYSLNDSKQAGENLKKNVWLSGRGSGKGKVSQDQQDILYSSAQDFSDSSMQYLTDAEYAASSSVGLLLGDSEKAKDILDSTQRYYASYRTKLEGLTAELNSALSNALQDGVISLDEEASIQKLRGQITDITQKLAESDFETEMNILQAKAGKDSISAGTFSELVIGAQESAGQVGESYWDAYGVASKGKSEPELNILKEGLYGRLSDVQLEVGHFGLGNLREQYAGDLGILSSDLGSVFKNSLPDIQAAANGLSKNTRAAIGSVMKQLQPTTQEIESLANRFRELGVTPPKALTEYLRSTEFYSALSEGPKAVEDLLKEWNLDGKLNFNMVTSFQAEDISSQLQNTAAMNDVFSVQANVETEWKFNRLDGSWLSPDGQYSFSTVALVNAGWKYNSFNRTWIAPNGSYSFNTEASLYTNWVNLIPFSRQFFGIQDSYSFFPNIFLQPNVTTKNGVVGSKSASSEVSVKPLMNTALDVMSAITGVSIPRARGGIIGPNGAMGFAAGGMVRGGAQLVTVAEEGTPEMIIPLGSQRRKRGLDLWRTAGHMLGAEGFANGGIVGSAGRMPEPSLRSNSEPVSLETAGGGASSVSIQLGSVSIQVDASGSDGNLVSSIEAQKEQIAEAVAAIFAQAAQESFQNTPARGGGVA